MFKPLFNKINFLWKPHKAPETMDYPYKYVLSKDYKDPDKIAEKLDEFLGKDGWDKLDVIAGEYVAYTKTPLSEHQKQQIEDAAKNHYRA